eukprot:SAG22_NODE_952_length_6343_cov_3.567265_9_plen_179_part_01
MEKQPGKNLVPVLVSAPGPPRPSPPGRGNCCLSLEAAGATALLALALAPPSPPLPASPCARRTAAQPWLLAHGHYSYGPADGNRAALMAANDSAGFPTTHPPGALYRPPDPEQEYVYKPPQRTAPALETPLRAAERARRGGGGGSAVAGGKKRASRGGPRTQTGGAAATAAAAARTARA